MGSSLRPTLTIDVAGQPLPFAQPFVQPFLELEQAPLQYEMTVPADDSVTAWNGTPPVATFDFLALQSDRDLAITFEVSNGASTFVLDLRGGGFPIVIPTGSNITQIDATNADTDFPAILTVFIAQEAA